MIVIARNRITNDAQKINEQLIVICLHIVIQLTIKVSSTLMQLTNNHMDQAES